MQRYADRFDAADEVRIVGDETDIRLSIAGRSMKVDAGGANIPGGEFFGCPVEDSAEGVDRLHGVPGRVRGPRGQRDPACASRAGASSTRPRETNEAYLVEMLDTDDGARRLGELGIGCNPGITRYMRNTLFDEKIDGTCTSRSATACRTSAGRTRARSTGTSSRTCGCRRRGSSSTARSSSRTVRGCSDDARSPLRQRPIFALVSAEVISSLGSQMTFLALPWFVLQTTGSATRMGVVLAVELLPIAILGIPSGSVIARYGARRTMLVSDLIRAPLLASIPLLHELGVFELSAAARDRRGHRHVPRAVLRVAAPDPAGARRRRRARGRAGERRRRGRDAGHVAARACRRGPPDRGVRARRSCSTSTLRRS